MFDLTRRQFLKWATVISKSAESESGSKAKSGKAIKASSLPAEATGRAEIHRLLGFATMSGEDPLKLWAKLRETSEWLVGPLAPDGWAGQTFVADHADIFAFRFLPIPSKWLDEYSGPNRAEFCDKNFENWFAKWPDWWETVGPKAPDNSYARLVWQMPNGGPKVTYEWAQTKANEVVCRISQSQPSDLVIQAYVPWNREQPRYQVIYSGGQHPHILRGRSWIPGTRDGMRWVLVMSEPVQQTSGNGRARWHGYVQGTDKLYICARQGQTYEKLEKEAQEWLADRRIDNLLDANRETYFNQRPRSSGWLAGATAAINDELQWNEVYTPTRRRAYITVTRSWAEENNSAPDFSWDSMFNALLVSQEDEAKCFGLVRDITSWQNDQGMFAQYGEWLNRVGKSIYPVAWGHTGIPIASLLASKIYLRRPNREFLEELYPRLLKSHRWWFADRGDGQPWRDGNRNGLLELGSNYPEELPYEERQQAAYYESYDDSPQWKGVARYNEKTGTLEQEPVERNCLYAMECWVLAWIADQLGRKEDAGVLRTEHLQIAANINRLLWDSSRKCYFNRHWGQSAQTFFPQVSHDIFFALLGRVAGPEQAAALRSIFHDPQKFAGEWILPTISRDDPQYSRQQYWRGKVWPPINWLIYQAFKIHEWDHEARLLAESSAKMFFKPWRTKGYSHENFFATTGEGGSDKHYTWGTLMALISIEEFLDVTPWHGLRFGNLEPVKEGSIQRYPIAGYLYDVSLSYQGMEVRRDGRFMFASDAPLEIRHVRSEGKQVHFEVRTSRPARIRAGKGPERLYPPGVTTASSTW